MRSINEAMQILNVKDKDNRYAKMKYGYKKEFIDLEARNDFCGNKVTTSMMKCANRFNYYGFRHVIINNNIREANYSRCN